MDKYGFFLNLSLNKYSLRKLYHMHPYYFKPYKNFCYLVEYILQGLYTSGISYSLEIMCFKHSISFSDFKLYASCIPYPSEILNYMFQEFLLLGRIYPSGIICFKHFISFKDVQ